MSITLAAAPRYQWQGLSSDTKPTDSRVGINDLYFAYDTGNLYIFSGTTWNLYALGGGGTSGTVTSVSVVTANGFSGTVANPTTTPAITISATGLAPSFASSITATLAASQNNYSPTGYVGGTTNRMLLAAASGGSTITGLVAGTDGWAVYVRNTSTTDNITFAHLSGSSTATNQFSCPQGVSAILAPLTGLILTYVTNVWTFA